MAKIYVAGGRGMVGSAIVRRLAGSDHEVVVGSRDQIDLTSQMEVESFFNHHRFDQIYLAAAKVGGIYANNTYPADFIYQNLMVQSNVIHSAYKSGVKKLLFLGSSCIYPRLSKQPISEADLLNGPLEPTNEPYAIAKIAGIKMCESYSRQYGVDYRSVMPTNLYGQGDNYHPQNSHVIPALIRRFHEAKVNNEKKVLVWGSGKALREFLYVDDMAEASTFVMNLDKAIYQKNTKPMQAHINIGTGLDCSIKELTETLASVVGFSGVIEWDLTKPDGAPRKLMDSSLVNSLGWVPKYNLLLGLQRTYEYFVNSE